MHPPLRNMFLVLARFATGKRGAPEIGGVRVLEGRVHLLLEGSVRKLRYSRQSRFFVGMCGCRLVVPRALLRGFVVYGKRRMVALVRMVF